MSSVFTAMRRPVRVMLMGAIGVGLISAARLLAQDAHGANQGPAAGAPAVGASALPPGWDNVDQRMVFLTVQLSTVESTITATNKALRVNGYQQAARQAAADQAQRGNELMDRNGGGPVPWQDFYGKTARKFFYHPTDNNTVYVNPDADAPRPPQFDYIYRANEQSIERASADVDKIGNKIQDLLGYRRQLETEQGALWGKIAFRGDSSLDIAARPLYRGKLSASQADDADNQSVAAAQAAVAFMVAVNSELGDAQKNLSADPQGTLNHLLQTTSAARVDLAENLLVLPKLSTTLADPRSPMGRFSRATKRLEDSAQNIADAYRLAADCDSKDDQAAKQVYRGQLQQMIFDYAAAFATADQSLTSAVTDWKLKITAGPAPHASDPANPDAGDIAGELDAAKDAHDKQIAAARRALMKVLDARLDAAADAGDLAQVQSLAAAKITIARDGTVPETVKDPAVLDAAGQAQKSTAVADDTLVAAYHAAVVSYTRARKFSDAQTVQDELNAFVEKTKVASTAHPADETSGAHDDSSASAASAPELPAGKIVRLTRMLPPLWTSEGPLEVRSGGIQLADIHYIRSADANFLERDFVLELWLTVDPKNPTAFIGVGSGKNGYHATPVNSIFMVVHPSGDVTMSTREGYGDSGMGKEEDPGEYVVRLEKKGTSVTYSIGSEDKDGHFEADVTQTFPDISRTPADFNNKNMHIFFGGGQYRQMRFNASAPHAPAAASAESPIPAKGQALALSAVLPPYMECATSYSATKRGDDLPLGHFIRTRAGTFLNRDFVFDVVLNVDEKMGSAIIGLGSGMDDNGGTPSNSVELIVERGRPHLNLRNSHSGHNLDPGEYTVRIEKKGPTVTYSIGTEENGTFDRQYTETVPDVSRTPDADFNDRNMHIFFGAGLYRQMRLAISSGQ